MKSGKERYLLQLRRHPLNRYKKHDKPTNKRQKYKNHAYLKRRLLEKFDYTCQICGYRPTSNTIYNWLTKHPYSVGTNPIQSNLQGKLNIEKTQIFQRFVWKELVAHHIDQNPYNTTLDNLTILCKKCHQQLHTKLRRKLK